MGTIKIPSTTIFAGKPLHWDSLCEEGECVLSHSQSKLPWQGQTDISVLLAQTSSMDLNTGRREHLPGGWAAELGEQLRHATGLWEALGWRAEDGWSLQKPQHKELQPQVSPPTKLHNKAGDNLILRQGMHLPTAAQPLAARKGSGTEKRHQCSLTLKCQKRTHLQH